MRFSTALKPARLSSTPRYVFVYIYAYKCILYSCTSKYIHTYIYMYICTHICVGVCMCACVHGETLRAWRTLVCVCARACVFMCVFLHIRVYVLAYKHSLYHVSIHAGIVCREEPCD